MVLVHFPILFFWNQVSIPALSVERGGCIPPLTFKTRPPAHKADFHFKSTPPATVFLALQLFRCCCGVLAQLALSDQIRLENKLMLGVDWPTDSNVIYMNKRSAVPGLLGSNNLP